MWELTYISSKTTISPSERLWLAKQKAKLLRSKGWVTKIKRATERNKIIYEVYVKREE